MEQYNWMSHYAANMKRGDSTYSFRQYDVENETGAGKVISCTVFPGVQTVYNDLYMYHCGKVVPRNDGIVEISYCMDGRYECEVSEQYCFYVSHGDLSIGNVGRREQGGSFPTKRYSGLTVFLNAAVFKEQYGYVLQELGINLEGILRAAARQPRRCNLYGCQEIDVIFQMAIEAQKMEMLLF